MFTGRYPHELSTSWTTALDAAEPTLAEAFAAAGYATFGAVGNLTYCCAEWGIARGFQRYEDFPVSPAVVAHTTSLGRTLVPELAFERGIRNRAAAVTDRFLGWLAGRDERPWFAFLNYYDAHAILAPPPPFDREFGAPDDVLFEWYERREFEPNELARFRDAYDGCIRSIDASVERALEALRARGVLDDTLVVITSDHGEQFGEHGLTDHGNSLYAQLLHVPLIVRWPGVVPAASVSTFASLRDLAATIAALAGLEAVFPGVPLAGTWKAGDEAPAVSPLVSLVRPARRRRVADRTGDGGLRSLVGVGGLHLIRRGGGAEELYDLGADPAEERDLIAGPAHEDAAAALRVELDLVLGGNR